MIPGTTYNYSALAQQLIKGERSPDSHIAHGFIAGAIGGLVGTALKSIAEKYFPPRSPREDSPPARLASRAANAIAGERLTVQQKDIAEQGMHWVFGSLIGGAYGAAVELVPELSQGLGLPFGAVVYGVMHEGILPAADLEEQPDLGEDAEDRNEMITHFVYGFATEVVRGTVRKEL